MYSLLSELALLPLRLLNSKCSSPLNVSALSTLVLMEIKFDCDCTPLRFFSLLQGFSDWCLLAEDTANLFFDRDFFLFLSFFCVDTVCFLPVDSFFFSLEFTRFLFSLVFIACYPAFSLSTDALFLALEFVFLCEDLSSLLWDCCFAWTVLVYSESMLCRLTSLLTGE